MNEEEKKMIKKFVEKCNKFDESVEIKGVSVGEEYRILETVCKTLDLVEKLQKENEEYSKQLDLDYVDKNYISKQKIKDEIEELKGKLEDISRRREKSKTKEEETVLWCLEIRTDERIKTLHELLENYKMNPKQ